MKTGARLLALLLLVILTSQARGQSALEKIVITYPSRSIASVDLYIAQERGFFRQEGPVSYTHLTLPTILRV